MGFAWHLYRDYAMNHVGDAGPHGRGARSCDPLGKTFDEMDVAEKIGGERWKTIDKMANKMGQVSGQAMTYGAAATTAAAAKVAQEVNKKEGNVEEGGGGGVTIPGFPTLPKSLPGFEAHS